MIFASLFSVVALPIVMVLQPAVFDLSAGRSAALALNGTLGVVAVLCYFYALHEDEASYVVPLYQTIPIFGFALGDVILGEKISVSQCVACLIIIAGALILSFDLTGALKFKGKVVLLMLAASLCYAINGVVFKLMALDDGFWTATFWSLLGKVVVGLLLFVFVPTYRQQFMAMFRTNRAPVLGLNALSEALFIAGDGAMQYATLLAPVVLVLLVNSFQPMFVLGLGVALSLFAPRLSQESLTKKQLVQKLVGTATIIVGTFFIGA
ncbi:MAG: hypothetical protein RL701_5543 [Pseudomonadota bacterium]